MTRSRIRGIRIEMDFPHQGEILTAVYPFYESAFSSILLNHIRGTPENPTGLVEPTAPQVASFIHEYFEGGESQAQEVTSIMGHADFRGFTGILSKPDEKVAYFIDYPKFNKQGYCIDRDDLLKRIGESRAQVPFEYLRKGPVEWEKVGKHPYFIAWAGGEEGAEKLAELASKCRSKEAYLLPPNVSDLRESEARIATLNSWWGDVPCMLGVGGDLCDCYKNYAFGMLDKSDTKKIRIGF